MRHWAAVYPTKKWKVRLLDMLRKRALIDE